VVGNASGSTVISSCSNTGAVRVTTYNAGGVVGYASGSTVITSCSNTGEVRSATSYAGGVAGRASSGAAITACYNTGAVTATSLNVGGVVGSSAGSVTACYNTGAVTASTTAGGVVGQSNGSVTACYNTGAVTAGASAGGVTGDVYGVGSVAACYWLNLFGFAAKGIANPASDDTAAPFNGSGCWPSFSGGGWLAYRWTSSGDEINGKYWKTIGQWSAPPTDGSKSEFPKLYWEP
jgi:hypothetical protein